MNAIKYGADGSVAYWSCGESDRDVLLAGFDALGLKDCVSPVRTDRAALKLALDVYASRLSKISPVGVEYEVVNLKNAGKNGFEVVRIDQGDSGNQYTSQFTAKVLRIAESIPARVIVVGGLSQMIQTAIQADFNRFKSSLDGTAVGQTLVAASERLGGVRLKQAGGIYWIPESQRETWDKLVQVVESAPLTGHKTDCYTLQIKADANAIRAIHDSALAELKASLEELNHRVTDNLSDEQRDVRSQELTKLLHRVEAFSDILGDSRVPLDEIIKSCQTRLTMDLLQSF